MSSVIFPESDLSTRAWSSESIIWPRSPRFQAVSTQCHLALKERSLSGAREGRTIRPQLLGVRSWPIRMLSEDQEGSARSEALTGRGASGTRSHGRCTTAMPPTIGIPGRWQVAMVSRKRHRSGIYFALVQVEHTGIYRLPMWESRVRTQLSGGGRLSRRAPPEPTGVNPRTLNHNVAVRTR